MEVIFGFLFVLLMVLAVVTVIGHAIWLICAAVVHSFRSAETVSVASLLTWRCDTCSSNVGVEWLFCGNCGNPKPSKTNVRRFRDLATTERQLAQFLDKDKLDPETFQNIKRVIDVERSRLTSDAESTRETSTKPEPSIPAAEPPVLAKPALETPAPAHREETDQRSETPTTPRPPRKRRTFSEVLNAFMEESNIRWGEIIGGLLIIGCSTALVVSLWSQISQIPVLKFLIFTTVTAVLFGIGMYTEHRWKLPTTSRGILTIATLLVPLNFLAIAAVSSSVTTGTVVIASEVLAPAIFFCLVYFAGRVITPNCAHLLATGVLGSSVGQLLVRHFAAQDAPPELLVALGSVPVLSYLIVVGIALMSALKRRDLNESEVATIFTVLGTMTFAALLPFGLLLYKAGPLAMSMMYLAPLVTLWGVPLLATGTVMWRNIGDGRLVGSRTAGTALGLLGLLITFSGMMLAWPNPASIVPAAIFCFLILTLLAIVLNIRIGHVVASGCFALAYLVSFHVLAGNVEWQNWRVTSLLQATLQISSGQVLVGTFAIFLIASEWLRKRGRNEESRCYLIAAGLVAVVSLLDVTLYGPIAGTELPTVWAVYLVYALSTIWIAWRHQLRLITYVGAALLLFALASAFAWNTEFSFPWQTALLVQASICAVAAIVTSRRSDTFTLSKPLNHAALISSVLVCLSLFQTNPWQVTSMQAERVFWIAGIWLISLWLNRLKLLFVAVQIAVTGAVILTVKATLQQYEWYLYLPHAFLHPWGLQIQGTVLAILCLIWIVARWGATKLDLHSSGGFWEMVDTRYAVDRLLAWILLGGFTVLSIYGALTGINQELGTYGSDVGFNVAGFDHREAFALGSWIIMGLLTLIMLANAWQRRKGIYFCGALVALSSMVPLLAARFETQMATATAWRFLAAVFLIVTTASLWFRNQFSERLKQLGWPEPTDGPHTPNRLRSVVLFITVVPVLTFTSWAATSVSHLSSGAGFSFLPPGLSYSAPLIAIALVLISYAFRERLPNYAFAAGLFFNLAVTVAYFVTIVAANAPLDSVFVLRLILLNAITCAAYSLLWCAFRKQWIPAIAQRVTEAETLLKIQSWLAVACTVSVIGSLTLNLVFGRPSSATQVAGNLLGWTAVVLTFASFLIVRRGRVGAGSLSGLLLCVVSLCAFAATGLDTAAGLQTLTVGTTFVAWLIFGSSFLVNGFPAVAAYLDHWRSSEQPGVPGVPAASPAFDCMVVRYSAVIGTWAAFLSLRLPMEIGPSQAWWIISPLVALSGLAAALQVRTLKRLYLYTAGGLFMLAVLFWWFAFGSPHTSPLLPTIEFNLIAACLFCIPLLWLELRARRIKEASGSALLSYHNIVVLGSSALLILITQARFGDQFPTDVPLLTWSAWLATVALMVATLWDRKARYTVIGLYGLGLLGAAILLQQIQLAPTRRTWFVMMVLAVYALSTALLWRKRNHLVSATQPFHIPARIEPTTTNLDWLSVLTILAVICTCSLATWIDLSFSSFELRITSALAVASQAITLALLAEGKGRARWQRGAVWSLFIGTLLFGWSWLTPFANATWLNRGVILVALVFGSAVAFGVSLNRLRSLKTDWTQSVRACLPWLLCIGIATLLLCMGAEVFHQISYGFISLHPIALLTIGTTLVASVVVSVLFALSPAHDPLGLTERSRTKYVYAAESFLLLLVLHVRLTLPWLFHGFFESYWPLVVIAVAFCGVVVSEALRRRDLLVLAQPIHRTGALIPLLPVIGFWIITSEVDFSLLLFFVGAVYALLCVLRRSFAFGVLAGIASNAGLWYMLNRTNDYQFLQHPQLWLVPAALSVLLAAYLNEDQLSEDQVASVRYFALLTVYASSTADIFLNGVANSPWLPLILGAFSLAGVFSGIMFRIRGLLLLGAVFLLLSLVTMIWYASANFGWTWLWYVAGIATGATIIFMFAVFEKKRTEVLRVVEGFKEWEI
jgi:hypothetical protein